MSNLDKKQLEKQIRSIKGMNVEGIVIFPYSGLQKSNFKIFKKYFYSLYLRRIIFPRTK